MVAFKGQKLPQGDVRSDKSNSDIELMGAGYKIWHMWPLRLCPSFQSIIHTLRAKGTDGRFVKPANSEREFEYKSTGAIPRASAVDYPEAAEAVCKIFVSQINPASPGGTITAALTTIVVKDPREKEKEVVARQGQARLSLLNIGGRINIDEGKVTDATYSVVSTAMQGIFDMPNYGFVPDYGHSSPTTGNPAWLPDVLPLGASTLINGPKNEPLAQNPFNMHLDHLWPTGLHLVHLRPSVLCLDHLLLASLHPGGQAISGLPASISTTSIWKASTLTTSCRLSSILTTSGLRSRVRLLRRVTKPQDAPGATLQPRPQQFTTVLSATLTLSIVAYSGGCSGGMVAVPGAL